MNRCTTFDFSITVPCTFNTPISVYVGGKEVKISPDAFNLGPVSAGSTTCYGGAAYDPSLTGGKLTSDNLLRDNADLVQNFGLWVTFSCGTLTLLGTLVRGALALLILFESWKLSTFSSVAWTFICTRQYNRTTSSGIVASSVSSDEDAQDNHPCKSKLLAVDVRRGHNASVPQTRGPMPKIAGNRKAQRYTIRSFVANRVRSFPKDKKNKRITAQGRTT